jgi:uncharacterized protein (DUF362 family)
VNSAHAPEALSGIIRRFSRRYFIQTAAGTLTSVVGGKLLWDYFYGSKAVNVFITSQPDYKPDMTDVILRGLKELGIEKTWVRGKSVMLKPNLVEPNIEAPHITTHPALIRSAAEVFRRWDAREVFVAEGSGHCRDADWMMEQSGLDVVLEEARIPFVDLNLDNVFEIANRLGKSPMRMICLPQTLRRADIIVSMPKMKTHHWMGATLSLKNMFGILPGMCYGWPKNVLHQIGIAESILDINAGVQPHLAIVDGIIGMEGDGPIMGSPKKSGVIVMGRSFAAVDATCARLMAINPEKIPYLAGSRGLFGPIQERFIMQRGELINPLIRKYSLPPGDILAENGFANERFQNDFYLPSCLPC